jgi:hypothetical protein
MLSLVVIIVWTVLCASLRVASDGQLTGLLILVAGDNWLVMNKGRHTIWETRVGLIKASQYASEVAQG